MMGRRVVIGVSSVGADQFLERRRIPEPITDGKNRQNIVEATPIGTIRDYEQSRREPLLATAAKLARALVSVAVRK
jgi:hypothetical protein